MSSGSSPVSSALFTISGVEVMDTFAEAFPIKAARLIITAMNDHWALTAATEMCGNATSVIACDVEAAIEQQVSPQETPDGRPGVSVLVFAFSREILEKAIRSRVGQCVLTCPTTACFDGMDNGDPDKTIQIGGALRYFGDGLQISKQVGGKRYWRIPVMDGEFLCEDRFQTLTGVAGGNLIFCGTSVSSTLQATQAAVDAMRQCPHIALPFPGGIVRSGSKVGSRYKGLRASTNDFYCPTSQPYFHSELPPGCGAAYEIVIDGLDVESIQRAMRAGLHAALGTQGLLRITAGNYGGKLGKFHFSLKDLL